MMGIAKMTKIAVIIKEIKTRAQRGKTGDKDKKTWTRGQEGGNSKDKRTRGRGRQRDEETRRRGDRKDREAKRREDRETKRGRDEDEDKGRDDGTITRGQGLEYGDEKTRTKTRKRGIYKMRQLESEAPMRR